MPTLSPTPSRLAHHGALAISLLISLLVHLIAIFMHTGEMSKPRSGKTRFSVTIVAPMHKNLQRSSVPASLPVIPQKMGSRVEESQDSTPGSNRERQPTAPGAGFVSPPDFSNLEKLELLQAGKLTLRIHVSPQGSIAKIDVLERDNVTIEMYANALQSVKLAPVYAATGPEGPIESYFDITISTQPEPDSLLTR